MATVINGDTVTVFKFPETGLVALCEEVTDFVRSGQFRRYNLDLSSATYQEAADGNLEVVFTKGVV